MESHIDKCRPCLLMAMVATTVTAMVAMEVVVVMMTRTTTIIIITNGFVKCITDITMFSMNCVLQFNLHLPDARLIRKEGENTTSDTIHTQQY